MANNKKESFSAQAETAIKDGRISVVADKLTTDVISEKTPGSGVTIDNVELKDGAITADVVAGNGTVAQPAVKVGAAENGFYQVSSTQLGVSVGNALTSMFTPDGISSDGVFARVELVTAGTGCTAISNGDGRDFTTVVTLTSPTIAIAGAADEANGVLIATLPDSAFVVDTVYMNVALQGTGTVDTDTPEVGVGSSIASGVVATLGGTPAFETYVTGTAAADCNGTATEVITSGGGLNAQINAGGDNEIFLNVADGWAGADTLTATGTVVIKWTLFS